MLTLEVNHHCSFDLQAWRRSGKELEKEPKFLNNGDAGFVKNISHQACGCRYLFYLPSSWSFCCEGHAPDRGMQLVSSRSAEKKDASGARVTGSAAKKGGK
uniref:Uncharacterized protein n=1 Tax=Salix viminalis TaxID=40686 RepID=A0A6N2NK67_SALVM